MKIFIKFIKLSKTIKVVGSHGNNDNVTFNNHPEMLDSYTGNWYHEHIDDYPYDTRYFLSDLEFSD